MTAMMVTWLLAVAASLSSGSIAPASCRNSSSLRSVYTTDLRRREHVFQNGLRVPLTLFWIDPAGKRSVVGTIAPGTFIPQQTNLGHAFILVDPAGKCRATVRIDDVFSGSYIGTSRYRPAHIDGWHVYVDQALDTRAEPAKTALATMEHMLRQTEAALPPAALAQVRTTPIFLLEHSGPGGMFHFDPAWLVAHGRTVELTHAIEISDASVFIETAKVQPWAVLHELAHAYYMRLSDGERAEVETAYRNAIARGLYRKVKRNDGSVGPAYATQNPIEYFAELSEAHFGLNDFFPFTPAELASYDPDAERLLARLWR